MVSRHVVTLANSIVGVSVLAMPFCFKQCGIVLATLSLMLGAILTRMVCYFLVKAAIMNRRRTYELLAWSTFGHTGKFMVEISIIGFLFGTLIAFMVVIGDLGPEILSDIFAVENNTSLRTIIMTALSFFVALPLGLLRNIDSLSSVSTASVLFYLFLMIKIFSEGIGPLWSGEYLERIHFWRSSGVLQCIPIFSMALSCQTQLFGIYDALPEPSLQKMNEVVKQAVNICTFFYFCVGFFGYIAFSHQNFGGNILLSFAPTWSTQLIKSMFLMSVVFSVPLVIFPCRVSLHSLIFKSASAYHHVHDISTNYIPESRMKCLTVMIVGFTLIIGILIPNIELVLGLVGSTTGSVICIIFPSIMFVRVTSKNTTERLLAQVVFFIGVVLMLLTTYATLYAAEQSQMNENIAEQLRVTEDALLLKPVRPDDIQLNSPISKLENDKIQQIHPGDIEPKFQKMISNQDSHNSNGPKIQVSSPKFDNMKEQDSFPNRAPSRRPPMKPIRDKEQSSQKVEVESQPNKPQKADAVVVPEERHEDNKDENLNLENQNHDRQKDHEQIQGKSHFPEAKLNSNKVIAENDKQVHNKDEKTENGEAKKDFVDKKVAEEFLKRLEEHQENQKKLIEEQKEILEELKQHHAQDVRDKLQLEKENPSDNVEKAKGSSVGKNGAQDVKIDVVHSESKLQSAAGNEEKIIKKQEKIIDQLKQNIETENKNAQLLEKLEEGLHKEAKKIDSEVASDGSQKLELEISPSKDKQEAEQHEQVAKTSNANQDKFAKESLKGIDKEKGVLVGSLGSHKREPQKDDNRNEKFEPEAGVKAQAGSKQKMLPQQSQSNDRIKVNVVESVVKEEVVPEPVIRSKVPSSAPQKKPVSENPPKAKVDREI